MSDEIWRDLFHCCALTAWVEIAVETRRHPPDSERVRRRACQLYEEELQRERHASDCRTSMDGTKMRDRLSAACRRGIDDQEQRKTH